MIAIYRPVCFRIVEPYRWLWVLLLVVIDSSASGLTLHSTSESFSGPGWEARRVTLQLSTTDTPELRLSIGHLQLPEPAPPFEDLILVCDELDYRSDHWRCPNLALNAPDLAAQGVLHYWPASGRLSLELETLAWRGNQLRLQADYAPAGWAISADLQALAIPSDWLDVLDLATLQGEFSGRIRLSGIDADVQRAELALRARQVAFGSTDGRRAAERLRIDLEAEWRPSQGFELAASYAAGELYLEPWYWVRESGEPPVELRMAGDWRNQQLVLDRLWLNHPDVVQLEGELIWQPEAVPPLRRAALRLPSTGLPALYSQYLKPLTFGTILESLETGGRIGGELVLEEQRPTRLVLDLQGIDLREADDRFSLRDLSGTLRWGESAQSRLAWREAGIHRIGIGAGELQLSSQPGRIELAVASSIPVLDGTLVLQQLAITPDAEVQARFGGRLDGLSMGALSEALNWPPLSGSLNGVIPRVSYRGHRLDVDGALLVRAFGGDLTAANLRLDRPFDTLPELTADIELFNLDLSSVTQTFDIGRVEGRLNGYVRDLQLLDWRPVGFDAYLHTPEGDTSRRRISQRAVETISDLGGGGAAGALSRGFLGLFEDFSYARLGVGCRLQEGVCTLRGLGPSPDSRGFHLIEGRGLPRIDVIGYNQRVDWEELLARLQAAARSEGPVIQ